MIEELSMLIGCTYNTLENSSVTTEKVSFRRCEESKGLFGSENRLNDNKAIIHNG